MTVGRDVIFDESDVCCPARDDFLEFNKPNRAPVNVLTGFDSIQSSLEGEGEDSQSDSSEPESESESEPKPVLHYGLLQV